MRRARNRKTGKPVLTAKEEAFVSFYMRGSNALRAAKDAGYRSPQNASFTLLRKLAVVAEIERRQALLREKENFDLGALLDWTVFAATHDAGEILKPGTFEILPPDQWPDPRKRSLIESFETTTTTTRDGETRTSVKIKFTPRSSHFDRAGFLMGMRKKLDVKMNVGRSIPLEVIDMLTRRLDEKDEAERAAKAAKLPLRKLSIAEIDARNEDEEEPRADQT